MAAKSSNNNTNNFGLEKRFITGLEERGVTLNEVQKYWVYFGGAPDLRRENDDNRHFNYLKTTKWWKENKKLPLPNQEFCICGQAIMLNCFIKDKRRDNRFLCVGSCCIKKFVPKGSRGRTCGVCENPHRNRNHNLCNNCKNSYCWDCYAPNMRRSSNMTKCKKCWRKQYKKTNGNVKCYKCNEYGHYSGYCSYEPTETCSRCEKKGHTSAYCTSWKEYSNRLVYEYRPVLKKKKQKLKINSKIQTPNKPLHKQSQKAPKWSKICSGHHEPGAVFCKKCEPC